MRRTLLLLPLLLLTPALSYAQGMCQPDGKPSPVVFGRSTVTFTSSAHNAVDPAGALLVADYFGEVRVKNNPQLITDFTVPKASVTPAPGAGTGAIPKECLTTLLPGMQGILAANVYTLTLFARNPAGVKSENPMTADFFLSSASVPASPGSLELVTP